MKPDSPAEPVGVRVRRLIRVSAGGKVDGPTPSRQAHSRGAFIGASSRPVKAITNEKKPISTSGNGFCMRTAIDGMTSDGSRPSAENTATITPPNAGVPPAPTTRRGRQGDIGEVHSEVMPNISVMLQPSDVRQTLPGGCAVGSDTSDCGFGARVASTSH